MLRRVSLMVALSTLVLPVVIRADRAAEIARIHAAAIGGDGRIAALQAYRATGRVVAGEQTIGLTVIAARPLRLRVEMRYAEGTLIQATDGEDPPWQLDTTSRPPKNTLMGPTAAADIRAEAEFDDPLVGARAYGCAIDDAGPAEVAGQPMLRLLVTQRLTKTFYLFVDPTTYFITQRVDEERSPGGRPLITITRFNDFRPVAGVLLPHAIAVIIDNRAPREAIFDRIEANPILAANTFTRPK